MDETFNPYTRNRQRRKKNLLEKMQISPKKIYVLLFKKLELGSAISVRLTKYTGKSKEFIHPKHFLNKKPWFTNYIAKGDMVLDLGSGNGQNAIKAARLAKAVVGLEKDEDLIEMARRIAKSSKIKNTAFKKGDLEKKLDIKNGTFDKVIFLDVLEHLYKRDQALDEIHRVMKPRGLLIVGVPNKDTSWKKLQRSYGVCSFSDPDHKIEFSQSSIKNLLKKHKFKIVNFDYDSYDTPLRPVFDIIGSISISTYRKISNWRTQKAKKYPTEASGFKIVAQRQ